VGGRGPPDGGAVLSLIEPGPRSPDYKLIGRATQVVLVTDDVVAKLREWHQRAALLMANLQVNLRRQCAIALDEPSAYASARGTSSSSTRTG
jgi:hypothetical protein